MFTKQYREKKVLDTSMERPMARRQTLVKMDAILCVFKSNVTSTVCSLFSANTQQHPLVAQRERYIIFDVCAVFGRRSKTVIAWLRFHWKRGVNGVKLISGNVVNFPCDTVTWHWRSTLSERFLYVNGAVSRRAPATPSSPLIGGYWSICSGTNSPVL